MTATDATVRPDATEQPDPADDDFFVLAGVDDADLADAPAELDGPSDEEPDRLLAQAD